MPYCVYARYLLIKVDGDSIPINPFDIKRIESDGDYIYILLVNGGKIIKRSTMTNIEEQLINYNFLCRVNRSFIVNVNYIKKVNKEGIIILDDLHIQLHKKYAAGFMSRFLLLD